MPIFEGPDFRQNNPRRAMGSETEFTIQLRSYPDIGKIDAIAPHTAYLASSGRDSWLQNGSRLYYDLSGDPLFEYTTPECTSASEVLLHEKAGEYLAAAAAHEMTGGKEFSAFKRTGYAEIHNSEGDRLMAGNSVGHHENYSTPLIERRNSDELPALLSYLATRPLWAGAGIITSQGFELCQKTGAVNYREGAQTSLTTHGSKTPLRIQTDRLEVRTGDGNMSPWAIRTKFAMTSLVLRLIEHGQFPEELIIDQAGLLHHAARVTSLDPLQMFDKDQSQMNAVIHQTAIAKVAQAYAAAHHVPHEERRAAEDVLAVTRVLGSDQPLAVSSEAIADRVDWAAKWTRLRRRFGIEGLSLNDITTDNLRAVRYDILWEALDAKSPSARHYRSSDDAIDPAAAVAALHQPPNTRAKLRAAYLANTPSAIRSVDWHRISHYNDTELELPSAYLSQLRKATKRVAALQQTAQSTKE